MKILHLNPSFVYGKLNENMGEKDECSGCLDEFPCIPIQFDKSQNKFHHSECVEVIDSLNKITIRDIVEIVKAYKETDKELKVKLTPTGPTVYDRVKAYLFG